MNSPKLAILYLDDEVNNLTGFKAAFRRDYTVHIANSAIEAQDILSKNEIHVIVSDQRMPDVTGVQFFKSILEKYPNPVRILLTGYADIEAVVQAINEGHVYRYISKPWEERDLKLAIDNALKFFKTQNELRIRNAELEKANAELEKFVYSASHDLRAPLASVLGLTRLAKMENNNPDCNDYLSKIETSVDKLDLLLRNIINYYRGVKQEEQHVEIDFQKLFKEALDSFEYYGNAKQIKFSVDVKQSNIFKGDEPRLKIILNNMLSNAIKYQRTDEGEKQVTLHATVENGHASIEVGDNGIGIEPGNTEKIFMMFHRSTEKNAGSGIGLYIVKETLNKLSGSIAVDSTPGKGSKFIIKIPNHHDHN
ncbi:MAG: hybrid sensor histidine kinase/response regulator [Chitinophagales bacterium]|nr:hybrid sensor histidine kinase/response regulator [Chitinophagales bacterium]